MANRFSSASFSVLPQSGALCVPREVSLGPKEKFSYNGIGGVGEECKERGCQWLSFLKTIFQICNRNSCVDGCKE